jgi:hypothetical protein
MVLTSSSIVLKFSYRNETIIVINDNDALMNDFISYIHSKDDYYEISDETFVFSAKEHFDDCAAEAIQLGLLPC